MDIKYWLGKKEKICKRIEGKDRKSSTNSSAVGSPENGNLEGKMEDATTMGKLEVLQMSIVRTSGVANHMNPIKELY